MPERNSGKAREIAVFRHNLFRISEQFIIQQRRQLKRYKPIYMGRLRYGAPPWGDRWRCAIWVDGRGSAGRCDPPIWTLLTLLADRRPALIHAISASKG